MLVLPTSEKLTQNPTTRCHALVIYCQLLARNNTIVIVTTLLFLYCFLLADLMKWNFSLSYIFCLLFPITNICFVLKFDKVGSELQAGNTV